MSEALRRLFLTTPTIEELTRGTRIWRNPTPAMLISRRFMAERQIAHLLVTRGPGGTRLYGEGRRTDFSPRVIVSAPDTTGAGDQLLALLLSFLHEGRAMQDAVRAAMDGVEERLQKGSP